MGLSLPALTDLGIGSRSLGRDERRALIGMTFGALARSAGDLRTRKLVYWSRMVAFSLPLAYSTTITCWCASSHWSGLATRASTPWRRFVVAGD